MGPMKTELWEKKISFFKENLVIYFNVFISAEK